MSSISPARDFQPPHHNVHSVYSRWTCGWLNGCGAVVRTALFVSFSSLLLGLGFVFGGILKESFEAGVFLFSVHPYDVSGAAIADV